MEAEKESNAPIDSEEMKKMSNLWWQVIVAVTPLALALGYLLAYLYELGYTHAFGIPEEFIVIEQTRILTTVSKTFLSGLGLFWICFVVLTYFSKPRKIGPIWKRLFLLAFFVVLFLFFALAYPRAWTEWYFMIPLLCYFIFILFVGPVITQKSVRGFRNKLIAQDKIEAGKNILNYIEKYLGRITVMILLIILPLVGMPYFIGEADAVKEANFWVPYNYQNVVVLRMYGDNLVCAGWDQKGERLNGTFFILKTDSEPRPILIKQNLGSLASYK